MSLDKSRIPKLSDSSTKLIPKKQRKSMNDHFVERTEKTRNKKGKKVSGGMVETRNQKTSEDKKAMLEVEIYPNTALDENRAGRGTEVDGNRTLTSESTPVEQGHDFANWNGTLDREEMSRLFDISTDNLAAASSISKLSFSSKDVQNQLPEK